MCTAIGGAPAPSGNSAAGPIAGGVIGGIFVVCLMTFLVWRFCIRNRRQQYEQNDWRESGTVAEKDENDFNAQRNGRASMHSVRSIASTVLTRASNVIQIAYIHGVTNRSVDSTPDLIPPVPPIPAASPATSTATTPHHGQDQHFFMPSDLRDSTCSDYTVDRTSYARSSMTPSMARGSVPSTAYRSSAIIQAVPAQTAIRGKANPVAVRSNGKNSPAGTPRSHTPPMPIMDRTRHAPIQPNITSPIVARLGVPRAVTVTKTPSNSNLAAAAKTPSPVNSESSQPVSALNRHTSIAESTRHNGDSSTFDDASSSDEESPADQSLMGYEKQPQFIKTSPSPRDGSFRSPSSAPDLRQSPSSTSSSPNSQARQASKEKKQRHKRSGSLNQIIEEAARRASREPRHGGLGSMGNNAGNWKRELTGSKEGPFSDANVARTP